MAHLLPHKGRTGSLRMAESETEAPLSYGGNWKAIWACVCRMWLLPFWDVETFTAITQSGARRSHQCPEEVTEGEEKPQEGMGEPGRGKKGRRHEKDWAYPPLHTSPKMTPHPLLPLVRRTTTTPLPSCVMQEQEDADAAGGSPPRNLRKVRKGREGRLISIR